MVFKGQDAWRKNPLIYQCYKNPLPHLRIALGIFSIYLFVDVTIKTVTARPPAPYKIKYAIAGDEGDTVPIVISKRH